MGPRPSKGAKRPNRESRPRADKHLLRLFVEHSPAAIAMLDRDMRYLLVSRRWITDYGLVDGDLAGRSHYDVFPEVPQRWKNIHRRCLAGAVERCEADPFPRADGSIDWIRWEIWPWYRGREVGGLIIFSEVITGRIRAEQALREAGLRIETMVRAANIGLWDWDIAHQRVYFSPGCKRQAGYDDHQIPSSFAELEKRVHPEDAARLRAGVRAFLEHPHGDYRCEYRLRHKDGSYRWMLATASAVLGENGQPVRMLGAQVDVTDSRGRAQELQDSRERLRGIVESAMDAVVSVDHDQRIILFNRAAETMFGYAAAAVVGQPLDLLIPEALRAAHADDLRSFGRTGVTTRVMGSLGAVSGRRADGAEVPLEASISQVTIGGQRIYTAILRDISQRLRVKQQLRDSAERMRELSHRLVESQELEQRRISTELHDRIGQSLTAISLNCDVIAALLPGGDARLAERLADCRGLLQTTMAAVRGLIAEIRPVALDDYGLSAGLRELARDFGARTGVVTTADGADPEPRLPPATELALYRIVQEALNNAAKHARAHRVSILLRAQAGGAELSVEDDGRGFDPSATPPGTRRHWGLLMMEERANAVGARLSIDSTPGGGTRIIVRTANLQKGAQ